MNKRDRPEKKEVGKLNNLIEGQNTPNRDIGYNLAITEYEAYLPRETELITMMVQMSLTIPIVDRKKIARAISERINND